jgi:hypothetical protein
MSDEENLSRSDTETDELEFEDYTDIEETSAKKTLKSCSNERRVVSVMGRSLAIVCSVPAACWGLHQAKSKTRRHRR